MTFIIGIVNPTESNSVYELSLNTIAKNSEISKSFILNYESEVYLKSLDKLIKLISSREVYEDIVNDLINAIKIDFLISSDKKTEQVFEAFFKVLYKWFFPDDYEEMDDGSYERLARENKRSVDSALKAFGQTTSNIKKSDSRYIVVEGLKMLFSVKQEKWISTINGFIDIHKKELQEQTKKDIGKNGICFIDIHGNRILLSLEDFVSKKIINEQNKKKYPKLTGEQIDFLSLILNKYFFGIGFGGNYVIDISKFRIPSVKEKILGKVAMVGDPIYTQFMTVDNRDNKVVVSNQFILPITYDDPKSQKHLDMYQYTLSVDVTNMDGTTFKLGNKPIETIVKVCVNSLSGGKFDFPKEISVSVMTTDMQKKYQTDFWNNAKLSTELESLSNKFLELYPVQDSRLQQKIIIELWINCCGDKKVYDSVKQLLFNKLPLATEVYEVQIDNIDSQINEQLCKIQQNEILNNIKNVVAPFSNIEKESLNMNKDMKSALCENLNLFFFELSHLFLYQENILELWKWCCGEETVTAFLKSNTRLKR